MKEYLLGIDVGTSSLKTLVTDTDMSVSASASAPYRSVRPDPVSAQIDADSMWQALLKCVRTLRDRGGIDLSRVRAAGISTLCPGLTALGPDNEVLVDPIIYSDRRSVREAEEIRETIGEDRLFALTANGSMAGAFSGSSLLWIRRHLPERYRQAKVFGHLNTLLTAKMTGSCVTDLSNASYTNLFETSGSRTWSEEICRALDVDMRKLPELREASDRAGLLRCAELEELGIPRGIPVAVGGADTPCAALAAGVVHAGDACESAGTTDVLTICVDKPLFDRRFINRCHVVPGTWIYQGAMSYTGASVEWFLDTLCAELSENAKSRREAFEKMNREASLAEPGCGGVVFLPYMQGERSPVWDPDARGVFFGLSLQTGRNEMNRAVLEACGYGLRQLMEIAGGLTGLKWDSIVSVGGGSGSDVWSQIKADILEKRIISLEKADMAAVGAALLGGTAAGIYKDVYEASSAVKRNVRKEFAPDPGNAGIYRKQYGVYTSLYPALKETFRNAAAAE